MDTTIYFDSQDAVDAEQAACNAVESFAKVLIEGGRVLVGVERDNLDSTMSVTIHPLGPGACPPIVTEVQEWGEMVLTDPMDGGDDNVFIDVNVDDLTPRQAYMAGYLAALWGIPAPDEDA